MALPNYGTLFFMKVRDLKLLLATMNDDMPVLMAVNGDVDRTGDWNDVGGVSKDVAIATTYGGYNGYQSGQDLESLKSEYTQGEAFEALFIS